MASLDDDKEFEDSIKLRLQRVVREANKIQEDLERRSFHRQNSGAKLSHSEGRSASSSKNSTPSTSLEKKKHQSYVEDSRNHKDKDRSSRHSSGTGNRYFRESNFTIVDGNTDATLVQWYGHFVGQRLVREMEIRPGKKTRLFVSGRDDSRMKPETLDESGLANKKGAEISNLEFENDWKRHGGEPYY